MLIQIQFSTVSLGGFIFEKEIEYKRCLNEILIVLKWN